MDTKTREIKYWLTIGNNPKIGACGFKQLIDTGLSFKELYNSSESRLRALGLSNKLIKDVLECQNKIDPSKVLDELNKYQISALTINDPSYPGLLKEIYDPPAIIYYKGNFNLDNLMVGIVGSRKLTDYGKHITYDLSYKLAQAGITIVSGLALGIDSIAHQAALDAAGKTVAVLGCGLDQIYPSSHEKLALEISEKSGLLISEFPIGVPPLKQNFPARNRIISGLSSALVVTEAAEGSGSLITARSALEQNREVFAVPGAIYNKNSFGPNSLIKMGGHLISDAQDIFDELGLVAPKEAIRAREVLPQSPDEKIIFDILKEKPKHIDFIIKEARLEQSRVSSLLTMMEVSGKIKHLGGMVYHLNN